ncbi:MAG: hypothetical protein IPP72_19025 [Chitinophagaceae bacterium]|nr:hypothetical protein [Chitinophagaceae bacterium]
MSTRIAIVTTHPIQYNAPLFKLLAQQEGVAVKVFYTWGKSVLENKFDPGFGKKVTWDIPLLEGYEYEFLENVAASPGSNHHRGIDNPAIISRILDYQPTILLIFGWNFKSHLKCLRYFKNKIPIFFRGDSTLLNEKPGLKTIIRRLLLRWVYRHIDYALYAGQNNRLYFLKHGLRDNQLIFAPHAVDVNRFMQPAEEYNQKAAAWKTSLGIKQDEITLLYAGKLEPVKNPLYLLQLADELKGWPVKLIIVGNGPTAPDLINKNNGIIFPLPDTRTCAAFIKELATDSNKLAEMKKAAVALIQDFSFNHIIRAFINKVNEIKRD